MLMPHPSPLPPPLRAFPPCARLRLRLRGLPSSTSPPPPPLSPAPAPRRPPPLRARASGESVRGGAGSALDALLSAAELLCLAPPSICSAVCAARLVLTPGATVKPAAAPASARLFVLQYVLLLGAVAIGALIRRRQWRRLSLVEGGRGGGAAGTGAVDLVERVDKVEDSVRGVVTAIGVLSRTVEKLSVRFRVLRRTLRDPISETSTLAQKSLEATRILAAQEKLLEKEIGSIQKVLYAMQEQQEKQLELILAIGEATRILDDKQDPFDKETVDDKQDPFDKETVKPSNPISE